MQTEPTTAETSSRPPAETRPHRRSLRVAGVFFLVAALLLAWFGAIAYSAVRSGYREHDRQLHHARQEQMARQVELARQDLATGSPALALSRLEWVLAQDPAYPQAAALRQQAQATLNTLLRPSPAPTAMPTTRLTAAHTPAPDPAAELEQARALLDAEEWEAAVASLTAFQARYPNYKRLETDTLLYEAYINAALTLLPGEKVEAGLFYLTQAEKLGDLPAEVADQRGWAELYLKGIAFYGVNWEAALFYFRDLCLAAPFFHDACDKLYAGLVAYGDQWAAAHEWCPAQSLYAEALDYQNDPAVRQKRNEAAVACLSATPTPAVPITATTTITATTP